MEKIKNNKSIQLGDRIVTPNSKPYIIAEIGVNHEGSIDKAYELIDLAKEGGADAAKFQSYKAKTLASKKSPSYWDLKKESTKSQYELFKKYDSFNSEDFIKLSRYCNKINIDFISTPFDDESIDFLDPIMSFYKIASADLTNVPLLRKVASKNKPIVLSTGASSIDEIDKAIGVLNNQGSKDIALLHCILNYPTKDSNANLNMIKSLITHYPDYIIGYSDHTLPDNNMTSLITSFLLGAVVIEKHFTYDKNLPGNDHYHAMDVDDLKCFVKLLNKIHNTIGVKSIKEPIETEQISRLNARRSIVLKHKIFKGHVLTYEDLTYKRPGTGISTLYWDSVIGKKINIDLDEDHILQWEDISDD